MPQLSAEQYAEYDSQISAALRADGSFLVGCPVPGCGYSCGYGKGFSAPERAIESFRSSHFSGHAPGKVPDLRWLEVIYKGTCTNCGSHFEYQDYEDTGNIYCDTCDAVWDEYGHNGRIEPQEG